MSEPTNRMEVQYEVLVSIHLRKEVEARLGGWYLNTNDFNFLVDGVCALLKKFIVVFGNSSRIVADLFHQLKLKRVLAPPPPTQNRDLAYYNALVALINALDAIIAYEAERKPNQDLEDDADELWIATPQLPTTQWVLVDRTYLLDDPSFLHLRRIREIVNSRKFKVTLDELQGDYFRANAHAPMTV